MDNKLNGTIKKPLSLTNYPSKQRSSHASFKLPVSPAKPEAKANSVKIPVPKLVARPRPKGKQFSLDFEPLSRVPGKLSPISNTRQLNSNIMGNHRLPTTPEGTNAPIREKPRQLLHARSLDDLLANETPVIVELTHKTSKYSRVIITASTYDLHEESETQEAEEPEEVLRIVTGTITIIMVKILNSRNVVVGSRHYVYRGCPLFRI